MLRKFVFLILFFGNSITTAQSYHPVLETNKYWDVFSRGYPFGLCWNYANRYFVSGDTTFNGKQYAIINSYNFLSYNNFFCPPYYVDTVPDIFPDFYLREDTETEKLYRLPGFLQTNEESLLFDFSAKVGDSIPDDGSTRAVIYRIDSIMLLNGEFRKAFYIRICPDCDSLLYAIEGIGLASGFRLIPIVCECNFQLACVKYENIPIFSFNDPALGDNSCYYFAGIPQIEKKKIALTPNPANDEVIISFPFSNTIIMISDLFGRTLQQQKIAAGNSVSLDLRSLSEGIYFVSLKDENGNWIGTEKLVKE